MPAPHRFILFFNLSSPRLPHDLTRQPLAPHQLYPRIGIGQRPRGDSGPRPRKSARQRVASVSPLPPAARPAAAARAFSPRGCLPPPAPRFSSPFRLFSSIFSLYFPSICFPLSPHPFPGLCPLAPRLLSQGARQRDLLILAAGRALQTPFSEDTRGSTGPSFLSRPGLCHRLRTLRRRAHRVGRSPPAPCPSPQGCQQGTPGRVPAAAPETAPQQMACVSALVALIGVGPGWRTAVHQPPEQRAPRLPQTHLIDIPVSKVDKSDSEVIHCLLLSGHTAGDQTPQMEAIAPLKWKRSV